MVDQEFLERAKRTLRLARVHQHLRSVADEVTMIRECLVLAEASPARLGITEDELVEMVRNGYLAEARIIFDLACDSAASSLEKDFFFSELVGLIMKSVIAARPSAAKLRATAVVAEPAKGPPAKADPLAEIERAKTERARLVAELASVDAKLERLRAENDAHNAAVLARLDPSNGLVPFEGLGQLPGPGNVDDLDFDGAFGEGPESLATPILPGLPLAAVIIRDGTDDDGEPAIELTDADIDYEEPDPVITIVAEAEVSEHVLELVASPMSADELCAIKFFGEKDAIALGLLYPLTNVRSRPRTVPPPLPPREAASDGAA